MDVHATRRESAVPRCSARVARHAHKKIAALIRLQLETLWKIFDKASLDADIFGYVRGSVSGFGIEVLVAGVKDVILSGEMREIINAVVQAEKQAQANVIRRGEEANAAHSLLNTAKLIEDSPVLMRLKELEVLEKVTEKIDKLTVFGGLDGVLKQWVTIRQ